MAQSHVNPQITDSVTQTGLATVGVAPAQALATLYQTSSASIGMAIQNAVHAQNNQNAISHAVVAEAVKLLLTSSAADAASVGRKIDAGLADVAARINKIAESMDGDQGGGG